jgi:hypothetical protein
MHVKVFPLLPLLAFLAALITACNSDGPIAPGGGDAPPAWAQTVGIVSVVPSESAVTVYWGEAVDLQDPPVEYLVYKDSDDYPFDQSPVVRMDNTPFAFTDLDAGINYRFGVRCADSATPPHVDTNEKVI